jgi:hypothetical protein
VPWLLSEMPVQKKPKTIKTSANSHVLGRKAFAAISAVEGLKLNRESSKRLNSLRSEDVSPEERRQAVIRAYSESKVHK